MAISLPRIPDRLIQANGREYLYFGGTAYLGLQAYPTFKDIFLKNVERYGMHYGASRRSNVALDIYQQAEAHLADWVGSEACLTMSSGYLAAQLVIQHLLEQGHKLFAAPNAHTAMLMNGVNKTNSFAELDLALQKEISVDGPLPVLLFDTIDFTTKQFPHFDALQQLPLDKMILVGDDSHGIGVVGNHGTGCYGLLKKLNPVQLLVCCSLGKGLGIQAGAVFGDNEFIASLKATPFYGGASPALPAFMGTLIDAKPIYEARRKTLMENYQLFLDSLDQSQYFQHMKGHPTFEFENAMLAQELDDHGFIITNFNYPDANGPLVSRIVLSAYHKKEDVQQLAKALNRFKDRQHLQ
ncbi:MAG: pyridoxal phosphate-dependent aminotransferase family protein [Bacteroidota bacterium]|nr:pyridoxal phosphate-dependent aminotransferase family protein [Bacteroidota bacterium]